jgi:hypothetical protein
MYARPPCKFFWSRGEKFFSMPCQRSSRGGNMTLHHVVLKTYTVAPNAAWLLNCCTGQTSAHFAGMPDSTQETTR